MTLFHTRLLCLLLHVLIMLINLYNHSYRKCCYCDTATDINCCCYDTATNIDAVAMIIPSTMTLLIRYSHLCCYATAIAAVLPPHLPLLCFRRICCDAAAVFPPHLLRCCRCASAASVAMLPLCFCRICCDAAATGTVFPLLRCCLCCDTATVGNS